MLLTLLSHAQSIASAVALQLLGILGIFFAFGFILSNIQSWTQANYQRSVGWKGILWTAWIGTPIHELSHVFFAKLFRHKIATISLFAPNQETGGLGHVDHRYNKRSIYQSVGNFFIGAGPLIGGGAALLSLLYFLLPDGRTIFTTLPYQSLSVSSFFSSFTKITSQLFTFAHIQSWQFWVFLYLSFCIVSHIAPSPQDRKGMWQGFIWIVFLLIAGNLLALPFRINLTAYLLRVNQYLGIFTGLFAYATILSMIHWVFSLLLRVLFRK